MSETFLVCAVVKAGAEESARQAALTKLVDTLRDGGGLTNVVSNEYGVAMLKFDDALSASQTANDLMTRALGTEGRELSIQPLSLLIDGGADQDETKLALSVQRMASTLDEPNQIVITQAAYERLPLLERDTYKAEEQISGRRVHRRFASGTELCFVISPIGDAESAVRDRANFVVEEYIKRACAEVDLAPYRADQRFSRAIRRDMLASIVQAKLVVAYLGAPPWNPNVMIEIGYRLAAGGAIVMIRDSVKDVEVDDLLPFDISDVQVLELPPQAAESDSFRRQTVAAAIVKAIQDSLTKTSIPWSSHHPFMQIEIDRNGPNHLIRQATKEAAQLFAHKGSLVGTKVAQVVTKLQNLMPEGQFLAFASEQGKLINELTGIRLFSSSERTPNVSALIPMVFENHPDPNYDQKAFLPVIVRYDDNDSDDRLILNVLYLNVTSATHINKDNLFECRLEAAERSALLWDNYAISYDNILTKLSIYKEVVARHVEALAPAQLNRILDVGCGTGNVTLPLLKAGKHVTAVDRSSTMLTLLHGKLLGLDDPHVAVFEQSAESLPFPDDRFDGVTILLALFAMETPSLALNQAIRVLKPGGTLVLTEPKECFNLAPLLEHAEAELSKRGELEQLAADWRRVSAVNRRIDPGARPKLPAEQIAEILKNRGFEAITSRDSHLGNCQTITAQKPR